MSDPEGIIARWSRRKADARGARPEDGRADADEAGDAAAPASGAAASEPTAEAGDPPFDSASLPPIEEIDAATDLRAFLEKNVPAELRRAALRRAWSMDPAIRDFVGLSENSWDFNAPNSISGFGSLSAEDARRLVALISGSPAAEGEHAPAPDAPASDGEEIVSTAVMADERASDDPGPHGAERDDPGASGASSASGEAAESGASSEPADTNRSAPRPRRHGGALPEGEVG